MWHTICLSLFIILPPYICLVHTAALYLPICLPLFTPLTSSVWFSLPTSKSPDFSLAHFPPQSHSRVSAGWKQHVAQVCLHSRSGVFHLIGVLALNREAFLILSRGKERVCWGWYLLCGNCLSDQGAAASNPHTLPTITLLSGRGFPILEDSSKQLLLASMGDESLLLEFLSYDSKDKITLSLIRSQKLWEAYEHIVKCAHKL